MAKRTSRVTATELAGSDAPPADETPAPKPARKAAAKRQPARVRIAPMPPVAGALAVRALDQTDYLPDATRHLSQCGPVATSNWIGRIGQRRISVRMGAPRSTIPKEIQALMHESGVTFGIAQPPATKGAVVVDEAEDFSGPPRARRTQRKRDREPQERTFAPLRALPVE